LLEIGSRSLEICSRSSPRFARDRLEIARDLARDLLEIESEEPHAPTPTLGDIELSSLDLDGALSIRASPGVSVVVRGATVRTS